jgi:hypothetical protein
MSGLAESHEPQASGLRGTTGQRSPRLIQDAVGQPVVLPIHNGQVLRKRLANIRSKYEVAVSYWRTTLLLYSASSSFS